MQIVTWKRVFLAPETHSSVDVEPGQWVQSVRSYSSQYNATSWSAKQVIGAPQVYPQYGDITGSWAQGNKDANEYIEVRILKRF